MGIDEIEQTKDVSTPESENSPIEKPDDFSEVLSLLLEKSERIDQGIILMLEFMEKRFQYDNTKDELFDKLYRELDQYKRDFLFQVMKPIFLDMILLYDRIENIKNTLRQTETDDTKMLEILESINEEILEILYRQQITRIEDTCSQFDYRLQKAISIEEISDPQADGTVKKVLRHGFRYKDKILRPEEVIVNKYIHRNAAQPDIQEK